MLRKMVKAKSTLHLSILCRATQSGLKRGYSGSSQMRLSLKVRFLQINGNAGEKKQNNIGNGTEQT